MSSRAWAGPASILVVLAIYSFPLAGRVPARNPNELSRIELAAALATRGSAAIDEVAEVWGRPQDSSVREGRTYSDKAPGLSLLSVPVVAALSTGGSLPDYWRLRHLLVWLVVALPGALIPFLALRLYPPVDAGVRVPMALVFALVTPLLVYSTVFFSHVSAGVLAVLAWLLALRPGRSDAAPSPLAAGAAGALSGFAVAVEYPAGLFGAVILATLLWRRSPARVLAAYCAGGLLGVLPALLYHQAAFGAIWATGYSFKADAAHAEMHGGGFFGVGLPSLASTWGVIGGARRGILYFCPLFLLAPVGLALMNGRHARDAGPLIAISLLYLVFAAGFADWTGGWSPAARHLVPVTLLWIWPIAFAVQRLARDTWWGLLVAGLTAISLCASLLSVAVTPFFPEIFDEPLAQLVLPVLAAGGALRNWISEATRVAEPIAFAGVAGVAVAAVGLALSRIARGRGLLVTAVFAITLLVWTAGLAIAQKEDHRQHRVQAEVLLRLGYPAQAQEILRQLGEEPRR